VDGPHEVSASRLLAQRFPDFRDEAAERGIRDKGRRPQPLVQLRFRERPRPPLFADTFTVITVNEVLHRRVSADDPLCIEEPLWPCQYFRITPPNDGRLDVVMTHTGGNLDLSFRDSEGTRWWYPISVPVKAGRTYQITIWEYEFPGLEFELSASLQPI